MLLTDRQIRVLCNKATWRMDNGPMIDPNMIVPFAEAEHRPGVISYGLSSFGYDARLGDSMKLAIPYDMGPFGFGMPEVIDPKDINPRLFKNIKPRNGNAFILPPHSFALGHTVERFCMPDDVMAICLGKSTYARCGLIVNVTPLEPGWEGQVTIEISNTTDSPAKVYAGEGICQFLFLRGDMAPAVTYATRAGGAGKYQGQRGITLPRMVQS